MTPWPAARTCSQESGLSLTDWGACRPRRRGGPSGSSSPLPRPATVADLRPPAPGWPHRRRSRGLSSVLGKRAWPRSVSTLTRCAYPLLGYGQHQWTHLISASSCRCSTRRQSFTSCSPICAGAWLKSASPTRSSAWTMAASTILVRSWRPRRRPIARSLWCASRAIFGKAALAAGLDQARGQAAILLDSDLQHPPALLGSSCASGRAGPMWSMASRRSAARKASRIAPRLGSSID